MCGCRARCRLSRLINSMDCYCFPHSREELWSKLCDTVQYSQFCFLMWSIWWYPIQKSREMHVTQKIWVQSSKQILCQLLHLTLKVADELLVSCNDGFLKFTSLFFFVFFSFWLSRNCLFPLQHCKLTVLNLHSTVCFQKNGFPLTVQCCFNTSG